MVHHFELPSSEQKNKKIPRSSKGVRAGKTLLADEGRSSMSAEKGRLGPISLFFL